MLTVMLRWCDFYSCSAVLCKGIFEFLHILDVIIDSRVGFRLLKPVLLYNFLFIFLEWWEACLWENPNIM